MLINFQKCVDNSEIAISDIIFSKSYIIFFFNVLIILNGEKKKKKKKKHAQFWFGMLSP